MNKFAAIATVLLVLQGSAAYADDLARPRADDRIDRRIDRRDAAAGDGEVRVDERADRRGYVAEGIENGGEGIRADERMGRRETRRGYAAESIDGNGVRIDDRQDRRAAIHGGD